MTDESLAYSSGTVTGNTLSKADILEVIADVSAARGWPSDQLSVVYAYLQALPGWSEWFDWDGRPDDEWYPAAADYFRGLSLAGATELATLLDQRGSQEQAQLVRDVMNSAPGLAAQYVVENVKDGAEVLQDVGNLATGTLDTANQVVTEGRKNPTPLLVGIGAAIGVGLLISLRR